MIKHSLPPIIPAIPKILILGSLPGDLSLLHQQYYAHPQNRFWKVLFQLFDQEFTTDYSERIKLLNQQQIALWDVCASAIRPGSMDTAISDVVPNDIPFLLQAHPTITQIFFNGQKAEKLYTKHLSYVPEIVYHTLPSTSPANAQFTLEKLKNNWSKIHV